VIAQHQFFHADKNVEMPDLGIIVYLTASRIDYAQADPHAPADLITKKKPVAWPLQKRRKQGDAPRINNLNLPVRCIRLSEVARASYA